MHLNYVSTTLFQGPHHSWERPRSSSTRSTPQPQQQVLPPEKKLVHLQLHSHPAVLPSHQGGIFGWLRGKPISAVKAAQVQRVLQLITWEIPFGALQSLQHAARILKFLFSLVSSSSMEPEATCGAPPWHGMLRPPLTHYSLFAPGQEMMDPPGYSYPVWATLWSIQSHLLPGMTSDNPPGPYPSLFCLHPCRANIPGDRV